MPKFRGGPPKKCQGAEMYHCSEVLWRKVCWKGVVPNQSGVNDTCLHSDDEVKKFSLLHCGCGKPLHNRLRIYIRSSAGAKLACMAGFSFTLKPVGCERICQSYEVRIKRKKRTFITIIVSFKRRWSWREIVA